MTEARVQEVLAGAKLNIILLGCSCSDCRGKLIGSARLVKILRQLRDNNNVVVPGPSVLIETIDDDPIRREWVHPRHLHPVDPEL